MLPVISAVGPSWAHCERVYGRRCGIAAVLLTLVIFSDWNKWDTNAFACPHRVQQRRQCAHQIANCVASADRVAQLSRPPPSVQQPEFAAWSDAASEPDEWLGEHVLVTQVGDVELARRLNDLCLTLEREREGEITTSSVGGFHSKNLISEHDPALLELRRCMHKPVAAFLRKRLLSVPPEGLQAAELHVAVVVQQLWVNVNRAGASNARHNHFEETDDGLGGLLAVGVYYPSNGELGTITSRAPLRLFPDSGEPTELLPQAGSIVIFSPELEHDTLDVPSDEGPRLSIAFNLLIRWLDRPLLRAAIIGDAGELRRLVNEGHDIEAADPQLGFRAVHLAAEAGHLDALKVLIELGADVSALTKGGWSPLGLAWEWRREPIWKHLGGDREAVLHAFRTGPGNPNR